MTALQNNNIQYVYHFSPLHYLAFIVRSGLIRNKRSLLTAGYSDSHFRTMSKKQDVERGFGGYTHLTTDASPRILQSKLAAGFPHIGIRIPSDLVDSVDFSLCRYNVAMTRQLRRGNKSGFSPSASNGRYYNGHEIPIARTSSDKDCMLRTHYAKGIMIEVLIHGDLSLFEQIQVVAYSEEDAEEVRRILEMLESPWAVEQLDPPFDYNRAPEHVQSVALFTQHAIDDPSWLGDNLEFDRL